MSTGKIDIIDEFYEVNFEKEKKSQQETMEKLLNTTQEEKERFYKIKYFYTIWLQKNYDCYSTELDHNFLFDEAIKIETYGGTKNLLITKWLDNTSKYPPKVIILIKFNKD
jgi:hypothetical protein